MSALLIIYPRVKWESSARKPLYKAIARATAGVARVLIVNRPIWPPATFRKTHGSLLACLAGGSSPKRIEENLFLFTPWIPVHDQLALGFSGMVSLNKFILRRQIEGAIKKLGAGDLTRISFVGHPLQYDWLGIAGESLKIYECVDEYSAYPGRSEEQSERMDKYEAALLREVDITLVVSRELLNSKVTENGSTYLVPNAVDFEHFSRALDNETQLPVDISAVAPPVIGFTGGIWGIFDLQLLKFIATERPEWHLLLVGNLSESAPGSFCAEFEELTVLENVTWLGWRDYETLPGYLKAMDVCLLPYVIDDWTKNCYPSKLHQYLAAGKPVVSTDLPEIRPFKDVVRIANSREEFLTMVEESLAEKDESLVSERIRVASENTWDVRARKIAEVIRERINRSVASG
ncbi:MAG: glycosyltransferase [Thermodesulfobacteriota bacterium]